MEKRAGAEMAPDHLKAGKTGSDSTLEKV